MGDMGDTFNAMKDESKARRASNRESSPMLLEEAGIAFITKNMSAHLIVDGPECAIDFWPGTGKWISRSGKHGRGVHNLIRFVKKDE
jgi:hypothetical protein